MSWADANLNEDGTDMLSHRLIELENSINTQISELRNEVGLAAAAIRTGGPSGAGGPSVFGDLERQLAQAVTVSLSAALEQIRESLTETIASAVAQLAFRLETMIAALPPPRPQWNAAALDEAAAALQHSVLLTLSSFQEQILSQTAPPPGDVPQLARDLELVNRRVDDLRSELLG